MWERAADTASVQIYDLAILSAWENHTPAEGIAALMVDQARAQQQLKRVPKIGQMPVKTTTGSIAKAQFGNQVRIVQASLL